MTHDSPAPVLYSHDTVTCVQWLIDMCSMAHWHVRMTHSYVCYHSFIGVQCLIHMCTKPPWYECHDSFTCVPWVIRMNSMTYVHDSFTGWLTHTRCMTHSYVWHDSFICVTWLIHMCDMTHSYVCEVTHSHTTHDSPAHYDRDTTHSYVSLWPRHDSFICVPCLIYMCVP